METSSSQLIKNVIGAAVRWLLVLVGGVLVKKGIITNEQSETYIAQALPVAIGAAMAGAALLWSIYQKNRSNTKIDMALEMKAGADRADLEKKAAA